MGILKGRITEWNGKGNLKSKLINASCFFWRLSGNVGKMLKFKCYQQFMRELTFKLCFQQHLYVINFLVLKSGWIAVSNFRFVILQNLLIFRYPKKFMFLAPLKEQKNQFCRSFMYLFRDFCHSWCILYIKIAFFCILFTWHIFKIFIPKIVFLCYNKNMYFDLFLWFFIWNWKRGYFRRSWWLIFGAEIIILSFALSTRKV